MRLSLLLSPSVALGWVNTPPLKRCQRSHVLGDIKTVGVTFMSPSDDDEMGLNELQTQLRNAVRNEAYAEAGRISSMLVKRLSGENPPTTDEEMVARRYRMSWRGQGVAQWLDDRLDALNFTLPTSIQVNSMEAVNAILDIPEDVKATTTLDERVAMTDKDMGIVISGSTGSGKTLSYLVPVLSTLSDSLFARQRIRVGAEERVPGDKIEDFVARIMAATTPEMRGSKQQRRTGIATGASLSTLGSSGSDVKAPLVLIVVPTRDLGVQIALQVYQLVGGEDPRKPDAFKGKANMFKYKGPKGVKIGCVLDDQDAAEGLKLQTDVAITTPKYLSKLIANNEVDPSRLRVVVYDEADLALEETNPEDLDALFNDDPEERQYTRLTFLVGASVTESLGNLAVRLRLLPEGKSWIAGATSFAPLTDMGDSGIKSSHLASEQSKIASLKSLNVCLDPGIKHERVLVLDNDDGMLTLTKLLRKELEAYEDAVEFDDSEVEVRFPRVLVFFPTEEEARAAIAPLRDAMWGEHLVCVFLPNTGFDPVRIMDEFISGKTNLMIATPNSVRGLDFPGLTHVYTLYLPNDDPREYVHLAGRVGRVGQLGSVKGSGGRVITVLKEDEGWKMDEMANELGFEFTDVRVGKFEYLKEGSEAQAIESVGSMDFDEIRKYLENAIKVVDASKEDITYHDEDDDEGDDDDDDDDDSANAK